MADKAPPATGPKPKGATKKGIMGLPTWAWVAAAGVGIVLGMVLWRKGSLTPSKPDQPDQPSQPEQAPQLPDIVTPLLQALGFTDYTQAPPSHDGGGGDGGGSEGGGGDSGGGAQPSPYQSPAPSAEAPVYRTSYGEPLPEYVSVAGQIQEQQAASSTPLPVSAFGPGSVLNPQSQG